MNTTKKAITLLLFVAVIGGGVRLWLQRHTPAPAVATTSSLFGSTREAIQGAKLLLVNVLDRDEFDDAHISGGKGVVSIHVPFADTEVAIRELPKNIPLVTYCSNYFCSACHTTAKQLLNAGFTNVKVFSGGMAEWYQLAQQEGNKYQFTGPAQRPYLKIRVKKPVSQENDLTIITAQELQKLIEDITILS